MKSNNLFKNSDGCFDYNKFFESQLSLSPEIKENYRKLGEIERKKLESLQGEELPYDIYAEFNPGRKRSTEADVTTEAISKRKCFLCHENRPENQISYNWEGKFEILVNPFPIFSKHFTIVASSHIPQDYIPFEIFDLARELGGLNLFFNGSKAGASAPDHLHLQAVETKNLPLLLNIESIFRNPDFKHLSLPSNGKSLSVPLLLGNKEVLLGRSQADKSFFEYITGIVVDKHIGSEKILALINDFAGLEDMVKEGNINFFTWIDENKNLRFLIIPRRSHRPSRFYLDSEEKMAISPGCIDMAGVIICSRKEDFEKININDIKEIYSEVGL